MLISNQERPLQQFYAKLIINYALLFMGYHYCALLTGYEQQATL